MRTLLWAIAEMLFRIAMGWLILGWLPALILASGGLLVAGFTAYAVWLLSWLLTMILIGED